MKTIGMVLVVLAAACGGQEEVSFSTLEDARARARENGTMNARRYISDNRLADCDVYARGDSTQSPDCPQGDGWASPELRCKDEHGTVKLKCSTVSDALGCMEESDFKTKAYAADDGKCQPTNKVPHPLPKLGQ